MEEELDFYSETERRYLLLLLLVEEQESEKLLEELDSIADKLENDEEGADELFYEFETRILNGLPADSKPEWLAGLDQSITASEEDLDLSVLRNRLVLLHYSKSLMEDTDDMEDLKTIASNVTKAVTEGDMDLLDNADDDLLEMEEEFIDLYFTEDHEDDEFGDDEEE